MPLTITKEMNGMAMYIHDAPSLYLTADDQVVAEGNPRAATLLVATGGQLAPDVAAKYGLSHDRPAAAREPEEGETPQEGAIVRAGDLPPDMPVIAVHGLEAGDEVEIVGTIEERPDNAEPGELIGGLTPVVEFTPSPKFEEEVNQVAGEKADETPTEEDEKAKAARPNKAKAAPSNKAG